MDGMQGWAEFNVAMVGATAALAGLVIVAASVNIGDIIKEAALTARLAAGIAGLVLALAASAVGLVPGIPAPAYGAVVIVLALIASVFGAQAARRVFQNRHPANRLRAGKAVIGFLAPAMYLVGAALLIAGRDGLLWFAAGSILAIVVALLVSWIVLVEVLR